MLAMEMFTLILVILNTGFPRGQCLDRYCSYSNDLPIALRNCHTILFADDTTIYTTGTYLLDIFIHVLTLILMF